MNRPWGGWKRVGRVRVIKIRTLEGSLFCSFQSLLFFTGCVHVSLEPSLYFFYVYNFFIVEHDRVSWAS